MKTILEGPYSGIRRTAKNREDEAMHAITIRSAVAGLAFAAVLGMGAGAVAEPVNFKANLNAASEVPPNDSMGTGNAEVTYDTTSKMLTWTINFSGLKGPATVAHFHGPADPGQNAGVAVLIGNNPTSPAKGSATLNDQQAGDLMAGRWYINVHTAEHRGGEIRGQVTR